MQKSPNARHKTTIQPRSAAILLMMTVLDTTWRAFVPTIGGTFIGVGLDKLFGLAPWMTIVMIIVGFAVSALLIMLQIRSVRRV